MTEEEREYFENVTSHVQGTDLIVVTYFRKELTKQCLERLFECTDTHSYRLTVIDNGSEDGTPELLMQYYNGRLIDNLILLDRNYGLEYARNTALRFVQSEYCVFFDNDLLCPDLTPDWLSQELTLMKKYPEFGCIALRPQVIVGVKEEDIFKDSENKEIVENNHVGATFMMFKTDILKNIKWSEDFTNRVADVRLGDIFKEKGLKMGWTKDIYCKHIWGENWSYPEDVSHFHKEIWPPPEHYDKVEIDPKTFKPI